MHVEYGDSFDISNYWLLGKAFRGGGLVPHEDEVPGLSLLRKERRARFKNATKKKR